MAKKRKDITGKPSPFGTVPEDNNITFWSAISPEMKNCLNLALNVPNNDNWSFAITGEYGQGKTRLLRYLDYTFSISSKKIIPIYISMVKVTIANQDLKDRYEDDDFIFPSFFQNFEEYLFNKKEENKFRDIYSNLNLILLSKSNEDKDFLREKKEVIDLYKKKLEDAKKEKDVEEIDRCKRIISEREKKKAPGIYDFNTWANHVLKELFSQFKSYTFLIFIDEFEKLSDLIIKRRGLDSQFQDIIEKIELLPSKNCKLVLAATGKSLKEFESSENSKKLYSRLFLTKAEGREIYVIPESKPEDMEKIVSDTIAGEDTKEIDTYPFSKEVIGLITTYLKGNIRDCFAFFSNLWAIFQKANKDDDDVIDINFILKNEPELIIKSELREKIVQKINSEINNLPLSNALFEELIIKNYLKDTDLNEIQKKFEDISSHNFMKTIEILKNDGWIYVLDKENRYSVNSSRFINPDEYIGENALTLRTLLENKYASQEFTISEVYESNKTYLDNKKIDLKELKNLMEELEQRRLINHIGGERYYISGTELRPIERIMKNLKQAKQDAKSRRITQSNRLFSFFKKREIIEKNNFSEKDDYFIINKKISRGPITTEAKIMLYCLSSENITSLDRDVLYRIIKLTESNAVDLCIVTGTTSISANDHFGTEVVVDDSDFQKILDDKYSLKDLKVYNKIKFFPLSESITSEDLESDLKIIRLIDFILFEDEFIKLSNLSKDSDVLNGTFSDLINKIISNKLQFMDSNGIPSDEIKNSIINSKTPFKPATYFDITSIEEIASILKDKKEIRFSSLSNQSVAKKFADFMNDSLIRKKGYGMELIQDIEISDKQMVPEILGKLKKIITGEKKSINDVCFELLKKYGVDIQINNAGPSKRSGVFYGNSVQIMMIFLSTFDPENVRHNRVYEEFWLEKTDFELKELEKIEKLINEIGTAIEFLKKVLIPDHQVADANLAYGELERILSEIKKFKNKNKRKEAEAFAKNEDFKKKTEVLKYDVESLLKNKLINLFVQFRADLNLEEEYKLLSPASLKAYVDQLLIDVNDAELKGQIECLIWEPLKVHYANIIEITKEINPVKEKIFSQNQIINEFKELEQSNISEIIGRLKKTKLRQMTKEIQSLVQNLFEFSKKYELFKRITENYNICQKENHIKLLKEKLASLNISMLDTKILKLKDDSFKQKNLLFINEDISNKLSAIVSEFSRIKSSVDEIEEDPLKYRNSLKSFVTIHSKLCQLFQKTEDYLIKEISKFFQDDLKKRGFDPNFISKYLDRVLKLFKEYLEREELVNFYSQLDEIYAEIESELRKIKQANSTDKEKKVLDKLPDNFCLRDILDIIQKNPESLNIFIDLEKDGKIEVKCKK